jgi:RNA ligase
MKMNMQKLFELNALGYLAVKKHATEDLILFDYTTRCQYEKFWTPETMVCRGIITNSHGDVMARPFPKFFNYGEKMPQPGAFIVEAVEKMDGSLGILYWVGDEPFIATRGSFTTRQAQWASQRIKAHKNALLQYVGKGTTLLFEIIYPANRVVVDYGQREELVLIGANTIKYGFRAYYEDLVVIAELCGFTLPSVLRLDTVQDYLDLAGRLDVNQEGWVLTYSNGEKFKIKGAEYLKAHKFMYNVSYGKVLDAMKCGTLDAMIDGVPDEWLGTLKEYKRRIEETVSKVTQEMQEIFASAPVTADRKQFAAWAEKQPKRIQAYMFALYNGRDIKNLIYKYECQEEG